MLREPFVVEQERFSGTLGELTYALRTGTVRPQAIDLYHLVRAYLAYFEDNFATDTDLATEALPKVAQVIELKVRLLLPRRPGSAEADEEALVEEAVAMVALLEELEEAIEFLRSRREERRLLLPAKTVPPPYPRPPRATRTSSSDLARLAARYRASGYFELAIERLSIATMAHELMGALRKLGRATFGRLLGPRDWGATTVGFVALLELVREGRVTAHQAEPYGDIEVARVVKAGARGDELGAWAGEAAEQERSA